MGRPIRALSAHIQATDVRHIGETSVKGEFFVEWVQGVSCYSFSLSGNVRPQMDDLLMILCNIGRCDVRG